MKKIVWLLKTQENGEHSPAVIFWYGILEKLGYNVIYYPYEEYEPDKFFNEMLEYQPDYIFHACYDKLHAEFIKLREFTKIYVVQSDDDWRFDSYAKFYIPIVDGTISYQAQAQWYLDNGATPEQIILAKWAFNPNTMLIENTPDKDIFLSHGGSLYGDREILINEFTQKGQPVAIATQVQYGQLLDLWSRSKYSLCFTKSSQGNFRQKKGRIAEIGYHSVLVSEPFDGINEYFEPGKEFIMFETVDEAIEKIKYYESHPDEYNSMLSLSRKRIWETNTVFHQWDYIMNKIDNSYETKNITEILKAYE